MAGQDSNEERLLKVSVNNAADMKKLSQNQYQLQVAKSVARNGKRMIPSSDHPIVFADSIISHFQYRLEIYLPGASHHD